MNFCKFAAINVKFYKMNKRENIAWIYFLRVLACFLVVFSHCCDPFVARFDSDYGAFLQGSALGSAVRCCVPLFVMMTGVLLFPVQTSLGAFYSKRIKRLLLPIVFWSLVLPVAYYFYLGWVDTGSASIDKSLFTLDVTLKKLYTFIFNFTYDTTPLWYLYMLVGLYFIIPVLSSWMQQASRKDIKTFLWVWAFSLFLPYIRILAPALGYMGNYGHMGLLGECDWNAYGTFYYMSGFVGYLVLAQYLVKYPLQWSWNKTLGVAVPMFVIGYAVTWGGYLIMQQHFPGNYAYLEIIWLFSGINVFMMTFAVFIVVQKLDIKHRPWLSRMASMTFGIYLAHFIFVQMGYDLYDWLLPEQTPAAVKIVLDTFTAFVVTYGLVALLSSNRYTRRLVA